jgi:hypothetical protein
MTMYRAAGWASFGVAGLAVVLTLATGIWPLLGAAVAVAGTGVVFFAFDQIIALLQQIRDGLVAQQLFAPMKDELVEVAPPTPPRTVAEINADLDRLKARL